MRKNIRKVIISVLAFLFATMLLISSLLPFYAYAASVNIEDGIITYNRNEIKQLSENFKSSEFNCKCGNCETKVSLDLITALQDIRDHFGVPVYVTSGYRCEYWNSKVGGARYSQHKLGKAADIIVEGISPLEVAQYAQGVQFVNGIGLYDNFVHIDVRLSKAYWKNNSETGYRETGVATFGEYIDTRPIEPTPDETLPIEPTPDETTPDETINIDDVIKRLQSIRDEIDSIIAILLKEQY